MKRFNIPPMRIRTTLIVASTGVVFFLLIVAGAVYYGNSRINTTLTVILDHYESVEVMKELETLPIHIRRHEKDYFLNIEVSRDNQEKCMRLWEEKIERMNDNLEIAEKFMKDLGFVNLEETMKVLHDKLDYYREGFRKTVKKIDEGEITTPQEANIAINPYKDAIYQVTHLSRDISQKFENRVEALYRDANRVSIIINRSILIVGGISMVFTFFFVRFLIGSITSPIRSFTHRIRELAVGEGDLTMKVHTHGVVCSDLIDCGIEDCPCYGEKVSDCSEIAGSLAYRKGREAYCPPIAEGRIQDCSECEVTGKLINHEMDELAYNVDTFISRIRSVVSDVMAIAKKLSTYSNQLSSTISSFSENAQSQAAGAEEVTATMEEIAAGIDNISNNSDYQFSSTTSMVEEFKELSELIESVGRDISTAQELSDNISGQAQSGNESLKLMNNSMGKINESSSRVSNIISIINDISDQINLLSLNASIEAARAGEQGRGFAVVADEISKLADETATSLKEIDQLIKQNEDEITQGMTNVNSTIESISMIVYAIDSISGKINEIYQAMQKQRDKNETVSQSIQDVKEKSDEVRMGSQEQKNAVNEVMKSITSINDLTQQNADGADSLANNAKEIAEMAENLEKRVDYFKVE